MEELMSSYYVFDTENKCQSQHAFFLRTRVTATFESEFPSKARSNRFETKKLGHDSVFAKDRRGC